MRDRSEGEIVKMYQKLMARLHECSIIKSKKHILDNEATKLYRKAIKNNEIDFEQVLLHMHRSNVMEKDIQTAENYIEAILAGIDKTFPLHLWG